MFVSSHLLSEIQLMCDRVAIVQGGVSVTQGTVEEVLAHGTTGGAARARPGAGSRRRGAGRGGCGGAGDG